MSVRLEDLGKAQADYGNLKAKIIKSQDSSVATWRVLTIRAPLQFRYSSKKAATVGIANPSFSAICGMLCPARRKALA